MWVARDGDHQVTEVHFPGVFSGADLTFTDYDGVPTSSGPDPGDDYERPGANA